MGRGGRQWGAQWGSCGSDYRGEVAQSDWPITPYSLSCSLPVSVGEFPTLADLAGVPTFAGLGSGPSKQLEVGGQLQEELPSLKAIQGTSTLMSLWSSQASLSAATRTKKVWLGEGLGSIPARTHERMLKWEFVDLEDFRPRSTQEKIAPESDTEKVVVLPGFEVAQPRKRPITNIVVWVQCFVRYSAAMAGKFPEAMPSHLVTVLKAFSEVEGTAWRDYDKWLPQETGSGRAWTSHSTKNCVGLDHGAQPPPQGVLPLKCRL